MFTSTSPDKAISLNWAIAQLSNRSRLHIGMEKQVFCPHCFIDVYNFHFSTFDFTNKHSKYPDIPYIIMRTNTYYFEQYSL